MTDPVGPDTQLPDPTPGPANATVGHNMGPAYDHDELAKHQDSVTKYASVAGEWLNLGQIEDDDMATRINDFVAGVRKLQKQVDDARKAAKKPHDDAGKEVQAAYAPLLQTLKIASDKSKALLTPYLQKKRAEEEAKRARAAEEARAAQEEAARQAQAAELDNDVVKQAEAEAQRKAADKAAKAAVRPVKSSVGSATGGARATSLRKQKVAVILSDTKLFVALRNDPEVKEVLQRAANRIIRAADYDGSLEGIVRIETVEKA